MQRRAVRVLAGIGYREDCRKYFQELKILTLPSIYILQCALYVSQHRTCFKEVHTNHNYFTRAHNDIVTPYTRLKKSRNGINFWCSKIWNKLPNNMKVCSYKALKLELTTVLTQNAYYSVDDFLSSDQL